MRKNQWVMLLAMLLCLCVSVVWAEDDADIATSVVTLPADLKTIEDNAFYGAENIHEVTVHEGINTIGAYAFAYSGLTHLTLPESVSMIGNGAFDGVSKDLVVVAPRNSYAYERCRELGVKVNTGNAVYRAVLVGNTYPGEGDNELSGCDNDVYAMRSMLSAMEGSNYEVTSLLNQTASGIQAAIRSAFADATEDDISLFYYSGHGTNNGWIVGTKNTFLSPLQLRTTLDQIPGEKIILLDCCYSGAFIGKSMGQATPNAFNSAVLQAFANSKSRSADNLNASGYHVLTACSKSQLSNSLTGDGYHWWGAFTYALCWGSGYDEIEQEYLDDIASDFDQNGQITLAEGHDTVLVVVDQFMQEHPSIEQDVQYAGDPNFVLWSK